MRAIVVGPLAAYSIADVAHGWVDGLRGCGVDTAYFDLSVQLGYFRAAEVRGEKMSPEQAKSAVTLNLLGECYALQPDVVFIVTGHDVDWSMVAGIRCKVVLILTECPYELEGQAEAAAVMHPDLILVNDPVGAEVFEQFAPTFYVPHAYRPNVHYSGAGVRDLDCVFVGTGFPNRIDWLSRADWSGVDLRLAGLWTVDDNSPLAPFVMRSDAEDCVDNTVTASLYRSSKCGFNVYRTDSYGEHSHADGWAVGPREVELAACGTWFARDPRGEGNELFPMLPTFSSPEELADQVRWALAHPVERDAAAEAARAAVADRTFVNNAGRALARLGF